MFGNGMTMQFGGLQIACATPFAMDPRQRIIGYRLYERILPVGHAVYALGESFLTESDGLILRKPSDGTSPFVFSLHTEYELQQEEKAEATTLTNLGYVTTALGLISLANDVYNSWPTFRHNLRRYMAP
eukprot:TRINITY_DN2142_c0_g2_i4.p1 TRINITY_DN2142_c0_g2~~TRINITY_DN2142_c0_g2_i4.p1  ORF type:complete len:129 (-),score=4.47 TRINITY_DN2142_c0_g2_i4:26-412(-)